MAIATPISIRRPAWAFILATLLSSNLSILETAQAGDDANRPAAKNKKNAKVKQAALARQTTDAADSKAISPREAVEIVQALRQLALATEKEESAPKTASKTVANPPTRPTKTIAPMSLDSKSLDALIDKTLTAAKVAPPRSAPTRNSFAAFVSTSPAYFPVPNRSPRSVARPTRANARDSSTAFWKLPTTPATGPAIGAT